MKANACAARDDDTNLDSEYFQPVLKASIGTVFPL